MKFKFLGRLREDDDMDGQQHVPIELVQQLSDRGFSEEEIVDELRDRGYAHGEINDALNEAVRASASHMTGGEFDEFEEQRQMRDAVYEQNEFSEQQMQPQEQSRPPAPEQPPARNDAPPRQESYDEQDWSSETGITAEQEELIEVIVAEHFTDVEDEFDAVYAELDELREEIDGLKEALNELRIRRDEGEKELMQKVNAMQDVFEQSNQRIGGMEKAFQQVLPSLVENVRELSALVKDMRDEE